MHLHAFRGQRQAKNLCEQGMVLTTMTQWRLTNSSPSGTRRRARWDTLPSVDRAVGVQVAATPRLLHDVIVQNLAARGIDVRESVEPVVSVVTSDQTESAHSKIVIVLGDSAIGEVQILIEGEPSQTRNIQAVDLQALVLELAQYVPSVNNSRPFGHDE